VEVRDGVNELRPRSPKQGLLEALDDHALVVDLDLHVSRLVRAEGRQRAHVGRRLDDDLVARIEEDLRHEVEGLLGAGRDHDVVGIRIHTLFGHEVR
jgi:hypothetical protein